MMSWGVAGKAVATVASAAVLAGAGVAAVAQNSMLLTPGDVQVVSGLSPERKAAQLPPDTTPQSDPVAFNVLLLGSDSRQGQGSGFGSADVYEGARSDTAMLLHVSADRENATVVSFPRDLRVDVPACGESAAIPYARFNVAFEVGGAACATALVEQVTGVEVDHVAVVDFKGFRQVVDALGGLRVCLTQPVTDDASHLDLPAGWQTLDGRDALALARARKSLADGSDIARIDRQQALMRTAYEQVVADGVLTNPVALYQFLSATGDAVTVSPSLSTTAAQVALAAEMVGVNVSKLRFITVPWVPAADGQTVELAPEAAELFEKLRLDTFGVKSSNGKKNSRDDSAVTVDDSTVVVDDSMVDSFVTPEPTDICGGAGIV